MLVEIGEGDGREFNSPKLDVDQVPFLANAGHVSEIAEEIVDVPDLQVPECLEEDDGACATCVILQFDAAGGSSLLDGTLVLGGELLAVAGVRIGVEDGLDAALDLEVELIFFTNPLVLRGLHLADLAGQVDRVVGLGAREGTEGVEGLHEEIVEALRVLLGGGSRQQVVSLDEIVVQLFLRGIVGALRGLVLEVDVCEVGKVYIHLADSL